jgi:hypothetical protein
VGETVRIFFGVGGPNLGANFHVIGEIFDKVYTGSPETYIRNEETWYVPPGSMATFELTLDRPGDYLLVDHALTRTARGALGMLRVTAQDVVPEPAAMRVVVWTLVMFVGFRTPRGLNRRSARTPCGIARGELGLMPLIGQSVLFS